MAIYSVTFSETDEWGEGDDRFKTRHEADEFLHQVEAEGKFARLVKWENGEAKEMARVNDRTDHI